MPLQHSPRVAVPLTKDQQDLVAESGRLVGWAIGRWPGLVRQVDDRDEAEQILWLSLVRAAANWDPEQGTWATWAASYMHGYLRNEAVRSWRRRRARLVDPLDRDADDRHLLEIPVDGRWAYDGLEPWQLARLHHAIDQLTTKQREAVLLRLQPAPSYRLAGQKMGISFYAAQCRTRAAMKNLRRILGDGAAAWVDCEVAS